MQTVSQSLRGLPPEQLLGRVLGQLRSHVLWESVLLFMPPLLACAYGAIYLWRSAWIGPFTLCAFLLGAVVLGTVAVLARYRPLVPSLPAAAEKIDRLSGAKDRFVTIATIDPTSCSTELLGRLRGEAASLQGGIELKRDFPFQLKRSFYVSLAVSLLAAALIHLWPAAYAILRPVAVHERLRELAEQMAQRPNLKELARNLQTLANKLTDPKAVPQEQQMLIQEVQKQIVQEQQQQRKEQEQQKSQDGQQQDRDLLSDASATLKSLEQQSGNGQEQPQEQGAGSGSVQSNLPQDGKGENKPSPGGDGQGKGDVNAQMSKDMQQGKSAQGDPKGDAKNPGGEKNSQTKGDAKGSEPDPNQSGAEKNNQTQGKTQSGAEEKGGKTKTSEDIPQGAPPSDRMGQSGGGKDGLKNARYVTVQLPEDVVADDAKGQRTAARDSKGNRVGAKLPVSNTPLPAHLPDAPAEKQQMPLEYRGIIR